MRTRPVCSSAMARWTGVLRVALDDPGGPLFKIAVSLRLSSSTALAGTGNSVIEELSDSGNIARLLVSKLGGSDAAVNAWVVDAASFSGSFAVYKEFVPSVDSRGDPLGYDPEGLPASRSIVSLFSKCIRQVTGVIGAGRQESAAAHAHPRTVLLGFSKGGIVLNQILSEISSITSDSLACSLGGRTSAEDSIFPASEGRFLRSISAFHFVDVGLNRAGAYLTDASAVGRIVEIFRLWDSSKVVRFVLHGTPRQWRDSRRPWIRREKARLAQLLREEEAGDGRGTVSIQEVLYFPTTAPSLQMHFEIIEAMQLG
ncbi:unnamed protein product [Spirodela intermedia]|uniref:Uncharacterized protein n=2 Tax=Spirodela intermedia TaxID=51605 RepID=A0A7I8IFM5_SPIIN|nr:unnamed protein product [Spirodela intermedia]CAA6656499.1 unnamed protein product [Spirodela intermedia]CAA7392086.1 unnamed protein product [Spirodela intermedia]